MSTHQRFVFYRNHLPNDFPSNENLFKFLGLITDIQLDNLCLKGNPLSFKSNSKGSVDIITRNIVEFENFCANHAFQRQHMASLIAQALTLYSI